MILPKLKMAPDSYKEMSDEEYERARAQMKKELPHLCAWLKNPNNELSDLPSDWISSSRS
jgi:hypothetical protein